MARTVCGLKETTSRFSTSDPEKSRKNKKEVGVVKITVMDVENELSSMGPELRQKVFEKACERDHRDFFLAPFVEHHANLNRAVYFGNEPYMYGHHCVYCWFDQYGELFYIGEGDTTRAISIGKKNRSPDFIERCEGDIYLFILVTFIDKEKAVEVERMLIQTASMRGENFVNTREVLTPRECRCFTALSAGKQMRSISEETKDKWEDYETSLCGYRPVYENFCDLLENGIGKATPFKKPNPLADRTKYWTINGVTKSRYVWCKEHDITVTAVENRMKYFGLSLKQALTFPKVKAGRSRPTSLEQWREMGLLDKVE